MTNNTHDDLERWMVDYEHGDDEPQHAVLSWLSPGPTEGLPEVGTELVRLDDHRRELDETLKLLAEERSAVKHLRQLLFDLRADHRRLHEALCFYADPDHYDDEGRPGEWITTPGHPGSYDGFEDFESDNGDRARAALRI